MMTEIVIGPLQEYNKILFNLTGSKLWIFDCFDLDDAEVEGAEGDDKEVVIYNISSEVKFFNTKANRYVFLCHLLKVRHQHSCWVHYW